MLYVYGLLVIKTQDYSKVHNVIMSAITPLLFLHLLFNLILTMTLFGNY